ncbi:GntR family transcriptional regulator [Pseudoclavibacter endophyticus]|uniref:GntR family transcriptional regulator n=1 Tax=Pseudoclavibacter endophyticus TaxID=1778590 RepID=A0A6H9WMU2_9MICO|nr:GntR family transcriptional regulator [Pseudoclavibacter endophyticus]KAB1649368.1 GntR family transcriptional regulator [Pseudoclavibacter endophyticus]GGA63151.1 GntR family transcriptional regulator [Pseudoclavibacter endophyticus]
MARDVPRPGVPPPVLRLTRTSTVHLIATELRTAIFTGALPVGSPLGEVELAAQLGVSRGPLREAAQRLVQEGVLTSVPGRGMKVSEITADEVVDVYEARLAVEGHAAARIIRDGRTSAVDAIERALDDLRQAMRRETAIEIGDADLAFHQTLVDASGSYRLSRAMATLALETRIATFSLPGGYSVRRSVSSSYGDLLAALRAGDEPAARWALDAQFRAAIKRLRGEDTSVETVETAANELPTVIARIDLATAPDAP